MNWVFFAAFIVASNAAKLDRAYLPPASALSAGGSPGSLLAPFAKSEAKSLPTGSFVNEHDGVVVDVTAVGTRASQSGLGGPRIAYGSIDSKVGDAAFRGSLQVPPKFVNSQPVVLDSEPDLSAFHQPAKPSKPSRTNFQISRDNGAQIIKYHNEIHNDHYSYGFEADNGIRAEEKGITSNGVQAEGGFSYVGDDGIVYSVAYTADQNGYRPVGSHLPTPPPIPTEILRALEQNSRDEAAGISEDGSYDAQKYNTGDYTRGDANGNYNNRETINFSIRPESSSDTSGKFTNNNQGAFIKPNVIGAIHGNKDTKLESSKTSPQTNTYDINFINRNNFDQGQKNLNAGIDSRHEFSPQKFQGSIPQNFESSLINKESSSTVLPPKPLSQQDLQESVTTGQNNLRPNSYDTSFSTVVSDNVPSKSNIQPSQESVTNSASEGKNQPIRYEQSFTKPTQGVFAQNFGIKNFESKPQVKPTNLNIPIVSKINDQNGSQNSFTAQTFNNQIPKVNNHFSALQTQSNTGNFNSFGPKEATANNDRKSGSSNFFPTTKQPERILTTPFESFTTINNGKLPSTFGINQKPYSGSNFANFPGLMSPSKFTGIPSSLQEIKNKTNPQTQFTSTSYNRLKVTNTPFSIPSFPSQPSQNFDSQNQQYKPTENKLQAISQFSSIRPNNINLSQNTQNPTRFNEQKFPSTSSDQFDSDLITKQDTKFTDENKVFNFSTNSQSTIGFNKQTNLPHIAPVSQTTVSENKDTSQTNGITQASISPFSSKFTTSLNIKGSDMNRFNPFQQTTQINRHNQTPFFEPSKVITNRILQSSFTDQQNFNENSNSQTQQYDNKIYEYKKPLQSFPSASANVANKQQGHFGTQFTMTTPFLINENVTTNQNKQTSFEMQTNFQFSKENLDKKTTLFQFQPSTQHFNDKLTTSSIQNPKDVSEIQNQDLGNTSQFEIYEYTKPLQGIKSDSPNSPKEQFNKNKNQESQLREQINRQSIIANTGSYQETTDNFQKDAQHTTQFDQEKFEKITEMPEFSQTASTFDSSVYQYKKPLESFLTTSNQEYNNKSQLPQKEKTVSSIPSNVRQQFTGTPQFGIQNRFNSKVTTTSQFTQGNQSSNTQFVNTVSTPFLNLSGQQLGNNINIENQKGPGEIYNYEKPNQTFSSSQQMAKPFDKGQNPQFNFQFDKLKMQNKESDIHSVSTLTYQNQKNSKPISSNSQVGYSYNSQERPQENSKLSEIYEYSKPAQTLTTPVQNNILSQNINQQIGQRFNQVINSTPNIFNQKVSEDTSTTENEPISSTYMVSQTNYNSKDKFTKFNRTTEGQTSFTAGINSKPIATRPQFGFQSACCRGYQTQKHQESQFTQSTVQGVENSNLKSNQNFQSQKLTTQGLIGTGEDFGGSRKPPSFDEKGYHY